MARKVKVQLVSEGRGLKSRTHVELSTYIYIEGNTGQATVMQATSSLARPLQSAAPVSSAQPKSSARKATSCTNIGLLRAQSPWLRKEDIRIALFKENSVRK